MSDRAIAIDVSCECGAFVKGLYSGNDVDCWQENHEHPPKVENDES